MCMAVGKMRDQSDWIDRAALRKTTSWPVAAHSLRFALVMGSVLNIISQGDAILNGGSVNLAKLALTYAVPFFSASFGAYSAFSRLGESTHESSLGDAP